jgi:hypothetical protein
MAEETGKRAKTARLWPFFRSAEMRAVWQGMPAWVFLEGYKPALAIQDGQKP